MTRSLATLCTLLVVASGATGQDQEPQPPKLSLRFAVREYLIETILPHVTDVDDLAVVRIENLSLLDAFEHGEKGVVHGKFGEIRESVQLLKDAGIVRVAWNLERGLSGEEAQLSLDEKAELIREFGEFCRENGLTSVFAPVFGGAKVMGPRVAPYVDGIGIQAQNLVAQEGWEQTVKAVIDSIRAANPNVEIIVQVSTGARNFTAESAQQVFQHVLAAAEIADRVTIFTAPKDTELLAEVLELISAYRAENPPADDAP